ALSIIIGIVFVILASLFMLADFDTIQRCVENQVDKKYEWMAAWGLAYTILYIYFKILRILIMIFGNGRRSK
ncbi:MAG: Bax inhibitor-1/YccA family protein, partial [Parasporobacterium sp.]|nr:Bax inhibitor-1/YccA family protein [Parasporobacterium sp.]